jgi:hypothetical protein
VLAAIKLGYTTVDDAFEYLLAHPEMKLNADREKKEEEAKKQEQGDAPGVEVGESDGEEASEDWLYLQNRGSLRDEPTWPMPRQSDAPYYAQSSDALGYLYLQAQAALPSLWRVAVEAAAAAWCEVGAVQEQEIQAVPVGNDGKERDEEERDGDSTDCDEEPARVRATRLPIATLAETHPHVLQAVSVGLKGVHRAVKKAWRFYGGDVHRVTDLVCLRVCSSLRC